MIYSLRGKLIVSEPALCVIECGGVGYKCTVPLSTAEKMPKLNSEAFIYTYMNVREDAVDLFGFYTIEELNTFKLLISVSGVGPKVAISLLSEFSHEKINFFIAAGDAKALTRASGVGLKIAQRIVLELKDKLKGVDLSVSDAMSAPTVSSGGNLSEAISALVALGYSQSEAAQALKGTSPTASVEELIKTGLRYIK
jgi:Holliday junction DNA helicase RuvA